MHISSIACKCRNICHVGIHICSTHCMSDSFILFYNWLMCLTICIPSGSISALIQKEFCHIKISLFTRYKIKFSQSHFRNLMSGYTYQFSRSFPYLPTDTICIANCNIKKITLSRSLIMSYGPFNHMSQVIKFMT